MKGGLILEAIGEAMRTALQAVQAQALDMVGQVLPYAVAVMGGILVVSLGIKAFKRVTGR